MKATELLEQEHRTIERVARACGVFAEMLQNGTKVPAGLLQDVIDFLRVFCRSYHQEQEEWLFAMLRQKEVRSGGCPIAVLEHENEKLTMLTGQLTQAV